MSNTTDVLMIGGSANGVIGNMPLDNTRIEIGAERYTPSAFTHTDGLNYWIAYPFTANEADIPTDEAIAAAIVEHGHKPAWDLNRA